MTVSPKRHIAKTITYRIISTTIGFLTMWLVTGSIEVGAAFGVIELVWKPIQYFIHERIWYKFVKYGVSSTQPEIKKDEVKSTNNIDNTSSTSTKRLVYTKRTD
jgi:uncharacterized membrane protein